MRNLFASCLAILLVFANIACVCAASYSLPASDQHAHHSSHDGDSEEDQDCPHVDCDGNCGLESFLPLSDRDASSNVSFKSDNLDDQLLGVSTPPIQRLSLALASVDPPPLIENLSAITPVQRKDLLLE